jgi:transposase
MDTTTVIGLDLGDKYTHACMLDGKTAKVLERSQIRTTPAHVVDYFSGKKMSRVILEAGTHTSWMQRVVSELGHEVIIANPRKVRMRGADNKDDRVDAEYLARLGRADPVLLYPLSPRSERVQIALAVVRGREQLVTTRTSLVNHVRGVVKTLGDRMPTSSTRSFHKLTPAIDQALHPALEPVMKCLEQVSLQIREHDREIARLCKEEFPETARLTQVTGVGDLTALTYVLIIEDPHRFPNSRTAGAFIGLVPRRCQSGDNDPDLPIRKSGDRVLRRVLVQAAHYILGPFGPESDLRTFGQRLIARGGKNAKKRAAVAVARKLATLLHALWKSGATYKPRKDLVEAA